MTFLFTQENLKLAQTALAKESIKTAEGFVTKFKLAA
jgi:hypothetical protein